MASQVITIGKDGSVTGLQVKPGKGVDLRQFGSAEIERASEIEWDIREQGWYVGIRRGKYSGCVIDVDLCDAIRFDIRTLDGCFLRPGLLKQSHRLMFREYDEAVKAEIAVLDHVRITQGSTAL